MQTKIAGEIINQLVTYLHGRLVVLVVNNEVNNALITREVNKKDSGGESRHFHGLWKYRTF